MTLALMIVESALAVLITFLANKGVPANYWSNHIYQKLLSNGSDRILATTISVIAIKLPDVIISVLIVIFAIKITPAKIKNTDKVIMKTIEEIR